MAHLNPDDGKWDIKDPMRYSYWAIHDGAKKYQDLTAPNSATALNYPRFKDLSGPEKIDYVHRHLSAGGELAFWEPLGPNGINSHEIKLLRKIFRRVKVEYYGYLTLQLVPYRAQEVGHIWFPFFRRIDQIISCIPGLRAKFWYALIVCDQIRAR